MDDDTVIHGVEEMKLERRRGADMCPENRDWMESRVRDRSHIIASRRKW